MVINMILKYFKIIVFIEKIKLHKFKDTFF